MSKHEQEPSPINEAASAAPPGSPAKASGTGDSLLDQVLEVTRGSQAKPSRPLSKPIGFHPRAISALINAEVVARHADEAPFLWLLRDRAVAAPHYSLRDLAKLDERVEAQIDGLRVAGDYGWRLSEKALDREEPGEVFTAGVLALESNDPERLNRALEVACKERALERGLVSAAGWTDFATIRPTLQSWLCSETAAIRRMAIGAFAVHRHDPGPSLLHRLYDDDSCVRTRVFQAVAELGRVDLLPVALYTRSDKDPACRFFATWAAARLGDRSAETIQALQDISLTEGLYQERAATLAVRCLPLATAVDWLRQLWKNPRRLRLAVIGAGAVGDPGLAGVIIEWMGIQSMARVAGEAFSMITGADLKYLDLNQDPPVSPKRQGGDEFEFLDADYDLPYPAQEKVARWWQANRDRFEPGRRYLCGFAIGPDSLRRVLLRGKQRQRAAAALELALLQSKGPIFEVRARGGIQERRLQAWTS
jgi:uncharacterized protein (TIGR02270 family)